MGAEPFHAPFHRNNLPADIRQSDSVEAFKLKLKPEAIFTSFYLLLKMDIKQFKLFHTGSSSVFFTFGEEFVNCPTREKNLEKTGYTVYECKGCIQLGRSDPNLVLLSPS